MSVHDMVLPGNELEARGPRGQEGGETLDLDLGPRVNDEPDVR